MANLADSIRVEIAEGRLGDVFTAQELLNLHGALPNGRYLIGGSEYEAATVRTMLANLSTGPGDRKGEAVKRGSAPLFVKQSAEQDGRYSLIDNDPGEDKSEAEAAVGVTHPPIEEAIAKIARDFVSYLREAPFRIYDNRSGWYPKDGAASGWQARLETYRWNDCDFGSNQETIECFVRELASARDRWRETGKAPDVDQVEEIYDRIRGWGNPGGTRRRGSYVADRLKELWSPDHEIAEVDSTLTKLYAFAEPSHFVIYDSRVATAIVSIAESLYRHKVIDGKRQETVNSRFSQFLPALGRYPGAGGTRPRGVRWDGWPDAYRVVAAQYDANRLCKAITDHLNAIQEESRSNWTLREVEAVLFMEGY